jgi:hypothetical protein
MVSDRAIAVGLGGLAMVAILLVAGSTDPVATGGSGVSGLGGGSGAGSTGGLPVLDFILPLMRLFLVAVFGLAVLAIVYDLLIGQGRVGYYLLMLGLGAVLLLIGLWLGSNREQQPQSRNQSAAPATPTPQNASGTGGGVPDPSVSPEFAIWLVALLVGVALATIVFSRGDALLKRVGGDARTREPDRDLRDLGRVAGAAADRLAAEETAVENEVTRAWRQMVDLLDVRDPQADTPRAFATAASEAGMAPDDVAELTELFEAVRYGGRPASADRRERALAAFRRIEETYGGEP